MRKYGFDKYKNIGNAVWMTTFFSIYGPYPAIGI